MKYLYKIFLLVFISINCKAQNYYPFPYDSVFFESEIVGKVLLPLVKNNDSENMLKPINNSWTWTENAYYFDYENETDESSFFPYQSWLGKVSFTDQIILFETAMGNQIPIDLTHNLNEKDTVLVHVPGNVPDLSFYVEIRFDTQENFINDTIRNYTFNLLDENYEATDFNNFSPIWENHLNVEEQVFRISMNNGILSSPAFYYFPNSLQYHYKAPIKEVLDLNIQNSYTVFENQTGDEIHTVYSNQGIVGGTRIFKKKICVSQEYKEDLNAFISIFDIWTRENTTELVSIEPEFETTFVVGFTQEKDTIYLNNYPDINRSIPDGFPEVYSEDNRHGYFYNDTNHSFQKLKDYSQSTEDGVVIEPIIDGLSTIFAFQNHVGGEYYNTSGGGFFGESYYKLLYYSINGQEWGEPITDSYILDITEQRIDKTIIQNGDGFIKISHPALFNSARIYNMQGRFIQYIDKQGLSESIPTTTLNTGIYLLVCWNGNQFKSFKFIK